MRLDQACCATKYIRVIFFPSHHPYQMSVYCFVAGIEIVKEVD